MHIQPLATLVLAPVFGIFAFLLAGKTKIPSILFFLVFGVLLGPQVANLIQPRIFRSNFPEYIALMVALILFEGGSQLKFAQFKDISGTVRKLLSVGVLVTFVSATLAVHWIAKMGWDKALLFGSLMIVTGPTVVLPILKRLRLQEKLHNVLKWEAILVDPLGVIIAVVLFEFLVLKHAGWLTFLIAFGGRIFLGVAMGWVAGFFIVFSLSHRQLVRDEGQELGGLFVFGMILLAYGLSEVILKESGLVTVTVAGIYFANKKIPFKRQIDHFKDQVVSFALGVLFILLASNIPLRQFGSIFWEGTVLVLAMVLVIRPLAVWLSTRKEDGLSLKEKVFLGLMAPRGIVSASLASLFAIEFEARSLMGRGVFLPLAFFVIAGTVIFYVLFSGIAAFVLSVKEGKRRGLILVGANAFGLFLGEELRKRKISFKFIDSSMTRCLNARASGFEVYEGSGFDPDFLESLDIKGIGQMLALTSNHEVNVLCCQTFACFLGRKNVYRFWDKTDTFESVTAHTYDESWGKPLILGRFVAPDSLGSQFCSEKAVFEIKQMERSIVLTDEMIQKHALGNAMFAIVEGEVVFLTPHVKIPGGSDVFFLRGMDG